MQNFNSEIFEAFQNKLKVGNRRGVHLNAIPGNSRYKLDLARLQYIDKSLPQEFVKQLLSQKNLHYKFSTYQSNFFGEDSSSGELEENDQKRSTEEQIIKLKSSLENLIFQNETIISEKGINTLGFGYPLLIRKDVQDGQITASPILIWNITIKPVNEYSSWEISRGEDDPVYINDVLINHLQGDCGISISKISEEMLEDGFIDHAEVHSICQSILQQLKINQNIDFLISEDAQVQTIKTKINYDGLLANKGDSVIINAGVFSLFEVQKQNIINDYENLKNNFQSVETYDKPFFQNITSINTDPSQQNILNQLQVESKIVIQGPPGTGKSQTLTGVLINALENGQKTIVVCEKQTALEVLHNAMIAKGFGRFCAMIKDSTTDRKWVVDAVRNVVDDASFKNVVPQSSQEPIFKNLEEIRNSQEKINTKHLKLNENLVDGKNWTSVVGEFLALKKQQSAQSPIIFPFQFQGTEEEYQSILRLIEEGEPLYKSFKEYENLYFLNPQKVVEHDLYTSQEIFSRDIESYLNLYKGIVLDVALFKRTFIENRSQQFLSQQFEFNEIAKKVALETSILGNNTEVYQPQNWWYRFMSNFSSKKKKVLQIQQLLQDSSVEAKRISQNTYFPNLEISDNLEANVKAIIAYREQLLTVQNELNTRIEKEFEALDFNTIYDPQVKNEKSDAIASSYKNLLEQIQKDGWLLNFEGPFSQIEWEQKMENLAEQYQNYQNNPNQLFKREHQWYQFYFSLDDFAQKLVQSLDRSTNWKVDILLPFYSQLLLNKADDQLEVHEKEYDKLTFKLSDFKDLQERFIQEKWLQNQKIAAQNFSLNNKEITVAHLFNKRSSAQHKKLSLRQIVEKDIDLFTNFFPIIFTTPDTCCNLFPNHNGYFDHVIFDEASQLKVEDNLPALLKGKNIIVAGDEHQMPPSNYFSKVFDGTYDDEDEMEGEETTGKDSQSILAIESLLDFAQEFDFNKNYLDFHYRSRHPYLIDFSNHAFYQSRLKPLPSNQQEKPIEFFQVDGIFEEHINIKEAEKIVEILKSIQADSSGNYPSVGIATFNITQRNFIKRYLQKIASLPEEKEFQTQLIALEQAGLFIKNLENIQGDERDIIIISTTYGRKANGKFVQSFGPVNHTKGYKLLNVIITRAKNKIYICNSVPEEYYNSYEEALQQEGSNNRKAVFYAYLAYCRAVSEGDEVKREHILKILSSKNGTPNETKVQENRLLEIIYEKLLAEYPQLKVSKNVQLGGYFLDLLIEFENKQALVVEILSKKEHQNQLAYLEDMHKEKIISGCGYRYQRIWSSDCWQSLDSEIQKILQ